MRTNCNANLATVINHEFNCTHNLILCGLVVSWAGQQACLQSAQTHSRSAGRPTHYLPHLQQKEGLSREELQKISDQRCLSHSSEPSYDDIIGPLDKLYNGVGTYLGGRPGADWLHKCNGMEQGIADGIQKGVKVRRHAPQWQWQSWGACSSQAALMTAVCFLACGAGSA